MTIGTAKLLYSSAVIKLTVESYPVQLSIRENPEVASQFKLVARFENSELGRLISIVDPSGIDLDGVKETIKFVGI